jgi:hypothetical protein
VKKFLLIFLIIIIFIPVTLLTYLGFMPVLSSLFGTDKPRDLGIKFTPEDLKSVRGKSQVEYTVLPDSNIPQETRQFIGARQVTAEFTSVEITATLNNQPWKLWPYKNVQIKFNGDGSEEMSGVIIKKRLPAYAQAIGVPPEAINFAMKYLSANPVFYLKGKAALADNRVSVFEPQVFEIGRMPMPISLFLAVGGQSLIRKAYAEDLNGMANDLSKVGNKKEQIIAFINGRLNGGFGSFFAKKAYFGENLLYFDGTLTKEISYSK